MAAARKSTKKGSPNFARIKHQILTIVAAIPPGSVVTYKDIGDWLDVMPRHVAYIIAMRDPVDRVYLPWQRVIADKDPSPHPRIAIADLPIDLPRQTRPEKHTPPAI